MRARRRNPERLRYSGLPRRCAPRNDEWDERPDRCNESRLDPRYFRPTEVELLLGDASKAKEKLGWQPKTTLQELCAMMVQEDMLSAEKDVLCRENGFETHAYNE